MSNIFNIKYKLNDTIGIFMISKYLFDYIQIIFTQEYEKMIKIDLDDLDDLDNLDEFDVLSIKENNKLCQITMESLYIKMIINNMKLSFLLNYCINISLCSIAIPLFFKISNDYFISYSNIKYGLGFVIIAIGFQIISIIHKNMIIEPNNRKFIANVHCELEDEVNKQILQIKWNKLRELNKTDLDRKKQSAKWFLLGFINSSINTFISLFSFFGYLYWISIISPISIIVYICLIGIIIIYYPKNEKKNRDINNNLWDKYNNKQTGIFTDIIHLQGDIALNKMKKYIFTIEEKRENDKKTDLNFIDTINIVYNLGFVINCIIILNNINSIGSIIIYIQYSCLMRSSIVSCINLYTQYTESKREYQKLIDVISSCDKKTDTKQIFSFDTIRVEFLEYIYPQDSNPTNKPFGLILQEGCVLKFKPKQIIKLEGDSGHGKSTFSDIINGIIPSNEYTTKLFVDEKKINGFDCFNSIRYYNEQSENICWKPSVYEIVSGRDLEFDSDLNPILSDIDMNVDMDVDLEEELVWKSLEICKCDDFLKKNNYGDGRKWIYSPNIGMSGGQKGRIGLARTIYRIICSRPKYITLDEVDKCIQSEMVVEIMTNIFEYAKANNIITFVIAHNPDVKKMELFDQVIKFTNGTISIG